MEAQKPLYEALTGPVFKTDAHRLVTMKLALSRHHIELVPEDLIKYMKLFKDDEERLRALQELMARIDHLDARQMKDIMDCFDTIGVTGQAFKLLARKVKSVDAATYESISTTLSHIAKDDLVVAGMLQTIRPYKYTILDFLAKLNALDDAAKLDVLNMHMDGPLDLKPIENNTGALAHFFKRRELMEECCFILGIKDVVYKNPMMDIMGVSLDKSQLVKGEPMSDRGVIIELIGEHIKVTVFKGRTSTGVLCPADGSITVANNKDVICNGVTVSYS